MTVLFVPVAMDIVLLDAIFFTAYDQFEPLPGDVFHCHTAGFNLTLRVNSLIYSRYIDIFSNGSAVFDHGSVQMAAPARQVQFMIRLPYRIRGVDADNLIAFITFKDRIFVIDNFNTGIHRSKRFLRCSLFHTGRQVGKRSVTI